MVRLRVLVVTMMSGGGKGDGWRCVLQTAVVWLGAGG
jgi:hypothetical protein